MKYLFNMNRFITDIHEAECDDQPEEFPCICQRIRDRRELEMLDLEEQEITGN